MESQSVGHNGVVTTLETFDERGLQSNTALSCEIRRVTGAPQQMLHLACPVFLLDFDKSLQFAKMVSVAQGVQHVLHRVVGLPVIVNHNADDIRSEEHTSELQSLRHLV